MNPARYATLFAFRVHPDPGVAMRFVLVGLAVLCLIVAFVTSSPAILGFCLLAAVLLSLGAVN